MSQQFEFGDWVQVTDTVDNDATPRECRYVFDDGTFEAKHMVYEPSANDYHWTSDEHIRPHPSKKREAFATLKVDPSPVVNDITVGMLDTARKLIEVAINFKTGGKLDG